MKKNRKIRRFPRTDEIQDVEYLRDIPFYIDRDFLRLPIEKRLLETKRRLEIFGDRAAAADFFNEEDADGCGADRGACSIGQAAPWLSSDCGGGAVAPPLMVTRGIQSKLASNPQTDTKCKSFAGGYDGGCEISYFVRYSEGAHEKLIKELERLKEFAKKLKSNGKPADCCIFEIGNLGKWEVLPYGTSGGIRYAYQIRRNGVTICIHSSPRDVFPQIRAVFGYESFRNGERLIDLSAQVKELINLMGAELKKEVISRVDLEVTFDIPMHHFETAFNSNRWVSRVRNWTLYTCREIDSMRITGITGGKSLKVRIYDKSQELKDKPGPSSEQKAADLSQWFDSLEDLTRVEFQLRRTFLKSIGVESCEDLERDLEGIRVI